MKIHGNKRWTPIVLDGLIEMRRSMTLRQVGKVIGVSGARVQQLIGRRKFCRSCRTPISEVERGRTCAACQSIARAKPCRRCEKLFVPVRGDASAHCSECRWEKRRCACGCGKIIVRPRRRYNTERRRWFHSHKAWNEWKARVSYDWRKDKRAA